MHGLASLFLKQGSGNLNSEELETTGVEPEQAPISIRNTKITVVMLLQVPKSPSP